MDLKTIEIKDCDLSELHDCDKCHGKIVLIASDLVGNTYCGYCHERVDYKSFYAKKYPDLWKKLCGE